MSVTILAFLVLATVLSAPVPAGAQESCDGKVCPEGFTCETYASSCDPSDSSCEEFTETYCQSPACAEDSDCPSGRRCRVTRYYDCTNPPPGGAPLPGDEGTAECPIATESWCDPAHQVPCDTAEDCGARFTCEPACDCEDPAAIDNPLCGICLDEERGITGGCYTPIRECASSADCPEGWTCADNAEGLCVVPGDVHRGCNAAMTQPAMACIPPFTASVVENASGVPNDDGKTPPAAKAGDSGGCSFSSRRASFGEALLLLAFAFGMRRRAQRNRN